MEVALDRQSGALPDGDGARLTEMHREFVALALDQQIADIGDGRSPSYGIELRRLDRAARRDLVRHFSDLDDILLLAWSALSGR